MPLAARRHVRLHGSSTQAGRGEGDHPWRVGPSARHARRRPHDRVRRFAQPGGLTALRHSSSCPSRTQLGWLDQASLDPGRLSYGKHCSARPGRGVVCDLQVCNCKCVPPPTSQHLPRICALSKATTTNKAVTEQGGTPPEPDEPDAPSHLTVTCSACVAAMF